MPITVTYLMLTTLFSKNGRYSYIKKSEGINYVIILVPVVPYKHPFLTFIRCPFMEAVFGHILLTV